MNHATATSIGVVLLLAACFATFASDRPGIAAHRYDEDWRAYCAEATAEAGIDRVKCLRLGPSSLLTLGGEWRERVEAVDAPDFGINARSDGYTLHRALMHGDLRHRDRFRLFVQLGSLHQSGRSSGPAPTDEDDADLQQTFVDLSADVGNGLGVLRIGRQELSLGSSRLISARESPNARRAFDGARVQWRAESRWVDAFLLHPVSVRPGILDNRTTSGERIWGIQWALKRSAAPGGLELYYLGFQSDDVAYVGGASAERRHSMGTRFFGHRAGFDWNVELIVQFGDWADQQIRAWTIASDTGFAIADAPGRPRFSLKANLASGDGDPADGRLQTFNALYPNPTYFSEASLIAPANILDVQPTAAIGIGEQVRLTMGWDFLWKHRRADAVYTPPASPLPGSERGKRRIGDQLHLTLQYMPSRPWQLRTAWVRFRAGAAVRQAGGADVDYWTASVAYRF